MADNFLERQYADYEARKAALLSGKRKVKSRTKFYTRPGKPRKDVADQRDEPNLSGD